MGFKEGGRRLLLAIALFAAMLAVPAQGRTILDLDPVQQPVALQDWGDAWMEPGASATPQTITADTKVAWEPTRPDAIYPLTSGKTLWIRFTIPPAPDAERWYLDIPYPAVNRISLYTPDSAGRWIAQEAGDLLPVASWPVPHRHPLLPVMVSAEEPRSYLLRVENSHSFSAPLTFVSESYLSRHEQRTSLILGIFFGLAGLAAVLALLSSISLKDPAYGLYALAVSTMALFQASMTGIAGLHLWPRLAAWNDLASLVLPVLTVTAFLWFISAAVSLPERSRNLHRLMMGAALLGLATAAAIALVEPSQRYRLQVLYVAAATAIGLACVAWASYRGDRHAGWLLLALLAPVLCSIFPMARTWGLIPVSFWTQHSTQLGIAVELPIILVILMLRSQQRREHNRRIQGLDRIDPATGLINGLVFEERLAHMMVRCDRLKYQSAVLLIDIVNVEQIRRDFGSRSADELPLLVAGRLLGAAREIDAVARLSELRFGILFEGPLTAEDVASEGPRLVARCLMPFKNKPIEWVAQVRVAQTMVPTERANARQVVERLEALLANVSPESKRAVFSLSS
jgi:two-component system, sensor histidine kinase LadS